MRHFSEVLVLENYQFGSKFHVILAEKKLPDIFWGLFSAQISPSLQELNQKNTGTEYQGRLDKSSFPESLLSISQTLQQNVDLRAFSFHSKPRKTRARPIWTSSIRYFYSKP